MKNPELIFGRLGNKLFQYAYIYSQMKRGIIPDIFVQDYRYFEQYEDEIKYLFIPIAGHMNRVSIHVRRASNPINPSEPAYSENPFYVNLSETGYYEKAIALFPGDKFLVFSDDMTYCKEKWGNDERFEFSEGNNEIDDLNLMAACKSNIIANSSYSWWGAFLNSNPNKVIIYPNAWYADGIQRTICPKTWISL